MFCFPWLLTLYHTQAPSPPSLAQRSLFSEIAVTGLLCLEHQLRYREHIIKYQSMPQLLHSVQIAHHQFSNIIMRSTMDGWQTDWTSSFNVKLLRGRKTKSELERSAGRGSLIIISGCDEKGCCNTVQPTFLR